MRSNRHAEVTRLRRITNRLVDAGASFGGSERNYLFVNRSGQNFDDLSGVSGLDSVGDARTNVRLDIDRDGFPDVGVVNANAPLFNLYRNRLGDVNNANQFVAIRFRGGNRSSLQADWSARDGYGAVVRVKVGDRVLLREHRAGEGFAGQNSKTMLVGLGEFDHASSIKVRWPSGKRQEVPSVPAGSLITVFENPHELPGGAGYTLAEYRSQRSSEPPALAEVGNKLPIKVDSKAQISIYVTIATWCQSCGRELANLKEMLSEVGPGTVAAFGVPIDPNDTDRKLEVWKARHQVPVPLLGGLTEAQKQTLRDLLVQRTMLDTLVPTTIIADRNGAILEVTPGPPSLSKIRELLGS